MANPWLPRWGDSAVRYNRGWTWPSEAEILYAKTQPTLKGTMKRQEYYPSRISDQIPWLLNFIAKILGYQMTLGLPMAHVDACIASCKFLVYVYELWLPQVRTFGPAATESVDLLTTGSGPDPVVLAVFNLPALPVGVAAVPPGVLNRLFDLVQLVKKSPGYNETIGFDLRIIGPEATTSGTQGSTVEDHMAPVVKSDIVPGTTNQAARLRFKKKGHQGVYIESQRGPGPMEFLAIHTEDPYTDDRPLLVPGVPEVRKYRLRFWDKGIPNGDWCDLLTVTVGP